MNEQTCQANKAIECNVVSCNHHCGSENYCSLQKICVGTHEWDPTEQACTDCQSFEQKS